MSIKIKLLKLAPKYLMVPITLLFITGCDNDEVFKKEQYKNVFALISESDNVSQRYHELGEESIGYVAASMGGTNPTEKPVTVHLVEDHKLIEAYNKTNFDLDVSKYIRALSPSKYDIESFQFTIPAGDISGRLPIRIRPDGLSPDSSYFIPLKVDTHDSYEVNPQKSFVLYRIRTKNYWAQSGGSTIYNMRGKLRLPGSPTEIEMPGSKVMHPISKNKVRIMPGSETFEANVNTINRLALVIEISPDNKVKISPYNQVKVTQVDGDRDFPNIFKIEDDGFKTYKTFLLRYNYQNGNTVYEMKEELRLEFNEDDEKKL